MRVNVARQGLEPPHLPHVLNRQFCSPDWHDSLHLKEKTNLQVTADGCDGERSCSKWVPWLLPQSIFILLSTDYKASIYHQPVWPPEINFMMVRLNLRKCPLTRYFTMNFTNSSTRSFSHWVIPYLGYMILHFPQFAPLNHFFYTKSENPGEVVSQISSYNLPKDFSELLKGSCSAAPDPLYGSSLGSALGSSAQEYKHLCQV